MDPIHAITQWTYLTKDRQDPGGTALRTRMRLTSREDFALQQGAQTLVVSLMRPFAAIEKRPFPTSDAHLADVSIMQVPPHLCSPLQAARAHQLSQQFASEMLKQSWLQGTSRDVRLPPNKQHPSPNATKKISSTLPGNLNYFNQLIRMLTTQSTKRATTYEAIMNQPGN